MSRLDERERRIALWAAGLAAATWVVILALSGLRVRAVVLAAIGLALAGLLALAARNGSRLLTGIAAVVLGYGPWGAAFILGLPYVLLAVWLLFRGAQQRALRRQSAGGRAGTAAGEHDAGEEPARPKPQRPKRNRRRSPRPSSRPAPAGPSRPRANKRYTPPRRPPS